MRTSLPSSKPRYTPIGPSTRCTIRHPTRAKSKLKELNRHAGVEEESRLCSTASPRPVSSRVSARRNWWPPPDGGGASSCKRARSARPRRDRSQSTSVRTRRTTLPDTRRAGGAILLSCTEGHANLGRPPMPSASRLLRAVRHRGLPRATRARLLQLELLRRIRPRRAYPLELVPTTIFLSHE